MNDLRPQIRKALAGSSSSAPVDTKSLLKLGKADEIMAALELLLASREINTASVTRGAVTTVQVWLTGAAGLAPAFQIRTPPPAPPIRQPEPRPIVHPGNAIVNLKTSIPTQQPKENAMGKHANQHPATRPITLALLELVAEQPGIDQERLISLAMKRAPRTTEKQAKKSLSNLLSSSQKVILDIAASGLRVYFPNDGKKPAKAAPAKAAKPVKEKKAGAGKPVEAGHAREQKTSRTRPASTGDAGDDDFSIMLSEIGYLHISIGVDTVVLTPQQAARAHRFIGLIQGASK